MRAAARSRAQSRLLGAVLVVLVAGLAVLTGCALLLTTGADRARQSALAAADPADTAVRVDLTDLGDDPAPAVAAARDAVADGLAPLPAHAGTWLTSTLRDLPAGPDGGRRLGWLAGVDDLTTRAELVAGAWPTAPTGGTVLPAALPVAAADALGLGLGDTVELAPSTGLDDAAATAPVTVQLVGLVQPRPGAWTADRLAGAGVVPDLEFGVFGGVRLPAAGPFLVDPGILLAAGPGLERATVQAAPDVAAASPADLDRVTAALARLTPEVRTAVSGSDDAVTARVVAPLAATVDRIGAALTGTRTAVLAGTVLTVLLTVAALVTAARVLGERRSAEAALLRARGATARQLVGRALPEAVVLALVAVVVAVPLAVVGVRALLGAPLPGSDPGPLVPVGVAFLAVGGALLLAVLLAAAGTAERPAGRRSGRGAVARSGADLLLVGLAAVAVVGSAGAVSGDPVLVAAPALVLLAGSALALRLPPLLAGPAERRATRGTGLGPLLVAADLARRPLATGATALLVLTTAAAVTAAGVEATWQVSQGDQADLRVGTDLAVPAVDGVGGAAVALAAGGTVSPVLDRTVALGSLLRDQDGDATRLIAVDTGADVLRGRVAGDWPTATAGLAVPDAPGVPLPAGAGAVGVGGTATGSGSVAAVTTLVLADATGARTTVALPAVPLDGGTREIPLDLPAAADVVGVVLDLQPGPDTDPEGVSRVAVTVTLPGAAPGWVLGLPRGQLGADQVLSGVELAPDALALTGRLALGAVADGGQRLLLTPARAPDLVPVLLSAALAADLGAAPGDDYTMAVGRTEVPVEVAGVVPDVPSVPGGPGVLADVDAVARALLAAGDLDLAPQAWWVAAPAAGAADALAAAGLPGAATRAGVATELRDGPLSAGLPLVLRLLAAGALLLAVVGAVLQAGAVRAARRAEVARLVAAGMPRAAVRRVLLAQHGAGTVLAVAQGSVVGALATLLLAPVLTGSPVPSARVQYPWVTWSAVALGLAVVGTAVVLPAVRSLLRADLAVVLREGGS